jgi:ABC-2 type transport system permease protein
MTRNMLSDGTVTPQIEPEPQQPSAIDVVRLVAGREIVAKLRDKAFLISTGVMLLLVAASVIVPLMLNRDAGRPMLTIATVGAPAQTIAEAARTASATAVQRADQQRERNQSRSVTEPGPAVRDGEPAVPLIRLTVRPVSDLAAADALLRTEAVDAALVIGSDGKPVLRGYSGVHDDLNRLITLSVQSQNVAAALQAGDAGADQIQPLLDARPPTVRLLDPPPPNADLATLLGIAFAGLFFITSFSFGLLIAQSVVEEKQSRVVELLVAAILVRLLLLGKVAGTTLLALGQVTLLFAVGLAGASVAGQSAAVTLLLHSGGWFLAFFALGFSMLSCLWAAAGALSSRQEDLQATTTPLQLLIMVPFFASIYVIEPGRWLTVLSYLPFTAPLSMPRRLLIGDAAWWEPVLAAAGMLVTGAVLVVVATRLYEGALLRQRGRTTLRHAWSGDRVST